MSPIRFNATLSTITGWTIVHLPEEASVKLPSRGQVMVEGSINGHPLQTPLEPDGRQGHWFRVNDKLKAAIKTDVGDTVELSITPMKVWPEPDAPADLQKALKEDEKAHALWKNITPMARWEWVRWIRSTNQPETRQRRILVSCSKLASGMRRPCCWNRNACSEPFVSKNGVLLEPAEAK